MSDHLCLNCQAEIKEKYCPNCGQKTDTHRITFKHFILHDLVHGIWHFDKGIVLLLKNLLTNPGLTAKEYIEGKRVGKYNIFLFLLFILGANILLGHFFQKHETNTVSIPELDLDKFKFYINEHRKLINFSIIPLFAINAFFLFWKVKYNFAENIIIAGYAIAASTLIFFFYNLLYFLELSVSFKFVSYVRQYFSYLAYLYTFWVYFSIFRPRYKFKNFAWRIVLFYIIFLIEVFTIVATVMVLNDIPEIIFD